MDQARRVGNERKGVEAAELHADGGGHLLRIEMQRGDVVEVRAATLQLGSRLVASDAAAAAGRSFLGRRVFRAARVGGVLLGVLASSFAIADTITYFHNDIVGSPIAASNASSNVIWREAFRPYGERLQMEPPSATNAIWFASRREDARTELVYMGARWYDPRIGRFLATDPVRFRDSSLLSFNRYSYANNNPYKFIDPDGQVDIYIGGALDSKYKNVKDYAEGRGAYFTHDQATQVLEFIAKQPDGEPINLIGHSWGGKTAAYVALESTRDVTSLTTVDPVSLLRPNFDEVSQRVGSWTNIVASPTRWDAEAGGLAAFIGRAWGDAPRKFASDHMSVDANHADFAKMMEVSRNRPNP